MPDSPPAIAWDDLLDDLRDQQCVLFVGPDIVQVNGRPLSEAARTYVKSQSQEGQIVQDYERDGFFLFKDGAAKTNARRYLKRFYRDTAIDDGIFRQILEIPFHLVVSINADTLLDDVGYRYGVRHRFGYFKSRNRAVEEVEAPSSATPLFYNLCGCKNQDDSLLLDYEDLYQLLQSALGTPGLPQKLLETLGSARTFLFLGFQFDKWHTQLLLRLLQGGRSDLSNLVVKAQVADEDTRVFLVNQFNIQFLGGQFDFFAELYEHCRTERMLRRLAPALGGDATGIVQHVQNNALDRALEQLEETARRQNNDEAIKAATMLMSRFRHWSDESEKGKMDSRDAFVERNRIVDAILETAQQLPGTP